MSRPLSMSKTLTRQVLGEFEGYTFAGDGSKYFSEDVEGVQLYEPRRGADDKTIGLVLFTTTYNDGEPDHLSQNSVGGVEMHEKDAVDMARRLLEARAPSLLANNRMGDALDIMSSYGGEETHHNTWVIDQVARALLGDTYDAWVKEHNDGDDGPSSYEWQIGICAMTTKPDAFASATYYDCFDSDGLTHTTVADAIEAAMHMEWESDDDTTDSLIAKIAPVEVTAWARKTVTNQYVSSLSGDLFALLEETADEQYGNPDLHEDLWTEDETNVIQAELAGMVRRALNRASIYQCDVVGKRSYAAVEIAAILTGETA